MKNLLISGYLKEFVYETLITVVTYLVRVFVKIFAGGEHEKSLTTFFRVHGGENTPSLDQVLVQPTGLEITRLLKSYIKTS